MAKHSPVSKDLAQGCIDNYHQVFKSSADRSVSDVFTSDVVFDKAELIAWLNSIGEDSVKITLGIYTPEFVAQYPSAKVNRLSTFIYPHNSNQATAVKAQNAPGGGSGGDGSGDGSDPLNLGTLTP